MSDLRNRNGNGISRLDFLKSSALAVGGGIVGSRMDIPVEKLKKHSGKAKNVIFLVSDGMSAGTVTMADLVKREQQGEPTWWINLYENPDRKFNRGLMDMASLDSSVTDSAAAASSWGCGYRINNDSVNLGPGGEEYKTILEIFRDAGKSTGLVTTTRITHATPSGFSANVPARGMEDEIAEQYSERDYDLLLGGGRRHFSADLRDDGKDLYQVFREKGYSIVQTREELHRAGRRSKLLGTFNDSHLPYSIDHQADEELQRSVPTLSEMTQTALDRLEQNEDGFILQVEGGRVDHGAHDNDAAGMIYDQIAFDDAVKVVMDYTEDRDDTLVILTTDHGNANPGLSAHGPGYRESPKMFRTLHQYRHSFEWVYNQFGYHWSHDSIDDSVSENQIREALEYATQTRITDEESSMIYKAFQGEFRAPYRNREDPGAVMAGVLANYNGVYFISTQHTADYVEIAAWGPGSEEIPAFVKNTALFDLMVEAAGVRRYAEG